MYEHKRTNMHTYIKTGINACIFTNIDTNIHFRQKKLGLISIHSPSKQAAPVCIFFAKMVQPLCLDLFQTLECLFMQFYRRCSDSIYWINLNRLINRSPKNGMSQLQPTVVSVIRHIPGENPKTKPSQFFPNFKQDHSERCLLSDSGISGSSRNGSTSATWVN